MSKKEENMKVIRERREEILLEALRLLDLVAAEFQSDPMSVQCFDVSAIVKPSVEITRRARDLGYLHQAWGAHNRKEREPAENVTDHADRLRVPPPSKV